MNPGTLLRCFALLSGLLAGLPVVAASDTIKIDKAASWVVENSFSLPEVLPLDTIEGGVYYVLIDNQIRVLNGAQPEFYRHNAELVFNRQGLESISQLNIVYAPSYESLVFNRLRIHRDGQLIDKLASARMSIIQREKKLENQLYDGRLTANIIIDDVRVGDIVEYSYTVKGSNPVYKNIFAHEEYLQWSVPIRKSKLRVLWGKSNPLYVAKLNTDIKVNESRAGGLTIYELEVNDTSPLSLNTETPGWYDPYAVVFLSESASWSEIALWALPLYDNAIDTGPEVKAIAATISATHTDPAQQIVEALKFVQSEIRYLGIEIGSNSHAPSPAKLTLQRRYGDCKDKAVLYISLLKVLGIQASPVLVNTQITRKVAEYPPTVDAFDHVIVQVQKGNDIYWLDPTRQYQLGGLKDIYQPDYSYALVVAKQTSALKKMNDQVNRSPLIINDRFDLTKGTDKEVVYETSTRYSGYNAEKQRYIMADNGASSMQDKYLDFYTRYYSDVEPINAMTMTEDVVSGDVVAREKYSLKKFWKKNENGKEYNASFYANAILSYLEMPEQVKRTSPYAIAHPLNIQQNIDIVFATDNWEFDADEVIEDNKFFYFKSIVKYDKASRTLHLQYAYETRTDHVTVDEFEAYMAARSKAKGNTVYIIADYIKSAQQPASDSWSISDKGIFSAVLLFIAGLLFVFVSWRIDSKKQPEFDSAVFYPVSLVKMFCLSFITFGIYVSYWFYRNWLYTKKQNNSTIMPVARGIFSVFWYYPLYTELVRNSIQRFSDNRVLIRPLAILFAVLYVLASILGNDDKLWLIVIIVIPALLIPFASYINHINDANPAAYEFNSRWLPRHTVLSIIILPLMALTFSGEFNITPSDRIVEGDKLMSYHVKFMHRKDLFPPGEKIIYFYSDAFLNMHDDGNGFTDNYVFSYWKDENGVFNSESEVLSNIAKIDVAFSESILENTIITLEKEKGGKIVLYISRKDGLDKKFVEKLKHRWNESRKGASI